MTDADTSMIAMPGGVFSMGATDFYPEEGPVTEVCVDPFELDVAPVTNAEFARFVEATGYVTVAERPLDSALYADAPTTDPGSLVFRMTAGPVDLRDWSQWWVWVLGASWQHPFGAGSGVADRPEHPVVQVAFEDAMAYADWVGKRIPTEAEWEFAARGGHVGRRYAWGAEPFPDGGLRANTWQGRFPYLNTGAKGWRGTSPVGSFPPNDFGLVDMIGNVWEWTASPWSAGHAALCPCSPPPAERPSRVVKGGSHLCAPEYCHRYRPAARSRQDEDSATTHLGFRCAR